MKSAKLRNLEYYNSIDTFFVKFLRSRVYPHTFHIIVPTLSERAKRNDMKGVGVYKKLKKKLKIK